MSTVVIEVTHFQKTYGDLVAVEDISFDVKQGEIFGLLGPNGAGKTSTLESLEGLRQADGGSLSILGVDPGKQPGKLRDLIGVQLQASALPASMTPLEAMQFFCTYHQTSPRFDLLEKFGLDEKKNSQFSLLSTGQQRRLALALAIAHQPPVVLLDEPTAGLDVPARVELHGLMDSLRKDGTTIILATHDMAEAEKMSDRVAILLKGCIAATGTPAQLTAQGDGLVKISVASGSSSLLSRPGSFAGVKKQFQDGVYVTYFSEDAGVSVPAILDYLKTQNDSLEDLRVERPSLEERFLEITKNNPKQEGK